MKKKILFTFLPLLFVLGACENNPNYVKQMKGRWKFAIGDNKEWAQPTFDDRQWDNVFVPSSWEEQGYRDYNGYAWYRKKFKISGRSNRSNLYLYMGRIDDVDEVYFNGILIGGTGSFPPAYQGAYDVQRRYLIPGDLIDYKGFNIVAVRVFDSKESGGIRGGKIGIYAADFIPVDINLEGKWKFHLNDSPAWKEPGLDDEGWEELNVPGRWEDQGYKDYDGYAWYRNKFDLPAELANKKLVFLAGKIDDIDEVYINGTLVGSSGKFDIDSAKIETNGFWDEFRGYYLPEGIVLKAKDNQVAIRVFDVKGPGGIYQGPIGIVTQEGYIKYWQNKKKRQRFNK